MAKPQKGEVYVSPEHDRADGGYPDHDKKGSRKLNSKSGLLSTRTARGLSPSPKQLECEYRRRDPQPANRVHGDLVGETLRQRSVCFDN